ncbi:MAG: hypothetical protein PVJ39_02855 [Gammaproteobacteria bacterium]|jgi:hypothetical protein
MKTYTTRPPGLLKPVSASLAAFALTMVFFQGTAFATTAANTIISNQATVNYDDANGNAQSAVNASVDVTVNLVEATPSLSTPANQTTFSGTAVDYTYTITTNANGPDTYNLSAGDNLPQAGITGNSLEIRDTAAGGGSIIASVTLAATSVATATGAIANGASLQVDVPNDGANDGTLNGFSGGETIIVDQGGNNWAFSVVSIDNDAATGTSQMTIQNNSGGSATLTVGMLIAEQQTFYLYETASANVDGSTVTNTLTAGDGVTANTTDDTITTVNIAPSLTVTKYVRNITAGDPGAGNCITVDTGLDGAGAKQYCDGTTTTVTGNPGDILEYVIEVANGASAGEATDVVISDPVPAFTTQTGNIALDPGTGTWSNVAPTVDNGDFAEIAGGTVYIYAGDGTNAGEGEDNAGSSGDGNGEGGRLAGGATTRGAFRVTIDN